MSSVKKMKQVPDKIAGLLFLLILSFIGCNKNPSSTPPPPPPPNQTIFQTTGNTINSISFNSTQAVRGINVNPAIRISFSDKVDRTTVSTALSYNNKSQN